MNVGKLDRAHDAVDCAVNAANVGNEPADQSLRPGEREEATERHAEEGEADVHALLAGLHVEPDLKDVVRDEHEACGENGNQKPRPAGLREEPDAIEETVGGIHFLKNSSRITSWRVRQ